MPQIRLNNFKGDPIKNKVHSKTVLKGFARDRLNNIRNLLGFRLLNRSAQPITNRIIALNRPYLALIFLISSSQNSFSLVAHIEDQTKPQLT